IVPIALRAAARQVPSRAVALEDAALACEREGTRASALRARDAAHAAAAAAYADADAVAYADAAASDSVLAKAASLTLDVLRAMSAPGVALWDTVSQGAVTEAL